jgi:nucleoside-diphosphate-sugar epimerase
LSTPDTYDFTGDTLAKELVLVTGGAGFIGSHLVRRLLHDGYQVRVLDDFFSGKRDNLSEVADNIDLIEGSMADFETATRAVQGVDCILHQGAMPSVPRSVADPLGSNHANVTGTLTMLTAARDAKVRRFVYAASSSAYGDTPTLPKVETMPTDPRSPYAVAKLAGENYCRAFYRVYGMETVCLRYFNVFGPRQDPKSEYAAVIPKFILAMLEGRPITIQGDGEQSRDFTYIDNTVAGNMLAMTAPEAVGEVCNLACGERFTLNQMVQTLSEIMGITPEIQYLEGRTGDVKHSLADISKAQRLLGYQPQVSFRDGLAQTVEYFRSLHEKANAQ